MTATTGEALRGAAVRGGVGRLPRWYYLAAAIAPILLLAVWGTVLLVRPPASVMTRVGAPAPAFELADLDGKPVSLAELRGRPVVINFWASWCGHCVEEFPLLRSAEAAHRDEGLAVVGIVFRDGSQPARDFMTRFGATWPALTDPGETVASRFGIIWPPDTYFIDRGGVVVSRQIGQLSAADLERGLAGILGEE
ncbi:MAG: redoxin domain-containing protein [Chloroflexi bacterium]|nr:redoxin domain-containing protein [Chloroflexota bacterium]